jgi:hypothetical protein
MAMGAVERDNVVEGMLCDELARCEEALSGIDKALAELPKGSLSVRKKVYKSKDYRNYYLKFRQDGKVVNQHVPDPAAHGLPDKPAFRKKHRSEAKAYEERVSYLRKLLGAKGGSGGDKDDKQVALSLAGPVLCPDGISLENVT